MLIKVLGPGCQRCKQLYSNTQAAVMNAHLDADVEKVEDIAAIMSYGVMATPALVIDEKLIFSGKVPSAAELQQMLLQVSKGK